MTTRKERQTIKDMKKVLQESYMLAEADYNKTTELDGASYYAGLADGYKFALELVRKLK